MKRNPSMFVIIMLLSFLLAGCQSMQTMGKSVTSTTEAVTSKVKVFLYNIDEKLYGQVPEKNRAGIAEAEEVLMEDNEKFKLAQLRVKKAKLREKYYSSEMAFAKRNRDIAQVEVNRLKWEAIERSNLGKKEENLKNIASLKGKKVEMETISRVLKLI